MIFSYSSGMTEKGVVSMFAGFPQEPQSICYEPPAHRRCVPRGDVGWDRLSWRPHLSISRTPSQLALPGSPCPVHRGTFPGGFLPSYPPCRCIWTAPVAWPPARGNSAFSCVLTGPSQALSPSWAVLWILHCPCLRPFLPSALKLG